MLVYFRELFSRAATGIRAERKGHEWAEKLLEGGHLGGREGKPMMYCTTEHCLVCGYNKLGRQTRDTQTLFTLN